MYAALTTLLTVGVLLLNFGAETVKTNLRDGLILIVAGAGLILAATIVFKLLASNIVEAKLSAKR